LFARFDEGRVAQEILTCHEEFAVRFPCSSRHKSWFWLTIGLS